MRNTLLARVGVCLVPINWPLQRVVMEAPEIHRLDPTRDKDPEGTLRLLQAQLLCIQREVPHDNQSAQWLATLEDALARKMLEYDEFMDERKPPRTCWLSLCHR